MSTSQSPQYGRGWNTGEGTSLEELTCPSGAVCLVQKPELSSLARFGALEKLDFLTGTVEEKVVAPATRGGPRKTKVPSFDDMSAEQKLNAFSMVDVMVAAALVAPKVEMAPSPNCEICGWKGGDFRDHDSSEHGPKPKPRDKNVLYTDSISMQDKMHVFNWAIRGFSDLEQFRVDSEKLAETMESEQGVGRAARRASTPKKRPSRSVVAK